MFNVFMNFSFLSDTDRKKVNKNDKLASVTFFTRVAVEIWCRYGERDVKWHFSGYVTFASGFVSLFGS